MEFPGEPLLFEPVYKETLWGGTALAARLGRRLPASARIGESWEVSGYGRDQSIVSGGPFSGRSLETLAADFPHDLLGDIVASRTFPLLCKFIDAADRLSVQVHPDDDQARANGWGAFGKTECWYVVDAKPGAKCILGFNRDMTIAGLRSAVATGTLPDALSSVAISPGDLLFIPAGTVHAILEGSLMYEVQETSDTTFRLYDWDRFDAAGKPRTLHINEACAVVGLLPAGHRPIRPVSLDKEGYRRSIRVACSHFAIEQYSFTRDAEVAMEVRRSFRIITMVGGAATLLYPGGRTDLASGATVLVPAIMKEIRLAGAAGADFLVSWVPDLLNEIVVPLHAESVPDEAIMNLGGLGRHNDLTAYFGGPGPEI
jgi:mannose-6-phosphate isomerase